MQTLSGVSHLLPVTEFNVGYISYLPVKFTTGCISLVFILVERRAAANHLTE